MENKAEAEVIRRWNAEDLKQTEQESGNQRKRLRLEAPDRMMTAEELHLANPSWQDNVQAMLRTAGAVEGDPLDANGAPGAGNKTIHDSSMDVVSNRDVIEIVDEEDEPQPANRKRRILPSKKGGRRAK